MKIIEPYKAITIILTIIISVITQNTLIAKAQDSIPQGNLNFEQQYIPNQQNAATDDLNADTSNVESSLNNELNNDNKLNNTEQTSLNTIIPKGNNIQIEGPKTVYNELLDRREYIRYYNKDMKVPVSIEPFGKRNIKLLDLSRSGVGLSHNNTLHKGDILPLKLKYKSITIPVYIQVLTATNTRAGGKFIKLDKLRENKLLYLSIELEADNNKLITRFR